MREEASLGEPRRFLIVTVLALAAVGVLVSVLMVRRLESTRIRLEFERAAGERVRALHAELDSYVNDLHALSAFFRASVEVTRAEFAEFARPLHARHRGLRAFDWVPRVIESDRAAYEARAREQFPGFRITELAENGALKPASSRSEYYPIDYIEPVIVGDEFIRGFDLGSHPASRTPLLAARDNDALETAGPVPLITDPVDQSGYLVILPHYRGTEPAISVAERRERFSGFIVGVLQLSEALRGAVGTIAPDGIDIEVADGGNVIAMYRAMDPENAESVRKKSARTLDYSVVDSIRLGDRELDVRCNPTPEFVARHASSLPSIVLGGGGLFLLTLLFYFARLQREVGKRRRSDEALRESERRYRVLVEHAPEAIVVLDVEQGRFIDANENAVRLLKHSREQLLDLGPADVSPRLQPDGRSSASAVKSLLDEALAGEAPIVPWVHLDSTGKEIPCEVRLVRLPPFDKSLVRGSIIDVSERRQAELRQLMMAHELDHRVKNNLAEVLALVEQSGKSASSYEEFRDAFSGRVRAMARTHEALAARRWHGVPFIEVANLTLGPYDHGHDDERIVKRGDPVMLAPSASSALGMMLHELAANAAKYGALAVASGRVDLTWRRDADGGLEIVWRESGGPPVTTPQRAGFGTRLVEGVVTHELGGRVKMEYAQEGFSCEVHIPSDHVLESAEGRGDDRAIAQGSRIPP